MRRPLRRNTAIDSSRMSRWRADFSRYRHEVTDGGIERWLDQFAVTDRDLAARVLDCVDFVGNAQMASAFRDILNGLEGWDKEEGRRRGKWLFVPFSVSTGESGDTMLHRFRLANGLSSKKYKDLFIHKSELLLHKPGPEDTVVFVDDFAGTGQQACSTWTDSIQELLPGNPVVFLVLVATSTAARQRIEEDTDLAVTSHFELTDADNVFSPRCNHFTRKEKETLLRYCRKADTRNPKGYGESGFVIVFAHRCPNNTIPILHVDRRCWEGLFRRYD